MISAWVACSLLALPQPVVMAERSIGPPAPITGGRTAELSIGELKATLFVPDQWKPHKGRTDLWMHFHTAAWFIVQEYQRAKVHEPVLVFNFGQGSTVYGTPFMAKGSLAPWISAAESELAVKVNRLCLTSFSAGFGAVRNLIQDPAVSERLKTVILCDSMYGSLDPAEANRVPLPAHVQIWKPLLDRALAKKTTWITTCSSIVPPTYAGTFEVARGLVKSVQGEMKVHPADPTQPQALRESFQRGRWFVWIYEGTTPESHMTHARRLAELIEQSRR